LIHPPFHYGLVLNVPGGVRYTPDTLAFLVRRLPAGSDWTVIGIGGRTFLPAMLGALTFGGHIRVGFEDNVYVTKGVLARSNAEQVERAAAVVRETGGAVATPGEVRKTFQLKE